MQAGHGRRGGFLQAYKRARARFLMPLDAGGVFGRRCASRIREGRMRPGSRSTPGQENRLGSTSVRAGAVAGRGRGASHVFVGPGRAAGVF